MMPLQDTNKETNGVALFSRIQNDTENTLSNLHINGCSWVFPVLTVNSVSGMNIAKVVTALFSVLCSNSNRKFGTVARTAAVHYVGLLTGYITLHCTQQKLKCILMQHDMLLYVCYILESLNQVSTCFSCLTMPHK